MLTIVASPAQAISKIHKFKGEMAARPEYQDRLSYARAWYAHQEENGAWSFGPSKYVGYVESYVDDEANADGRRTEAQLRNWFAEVNPTTTLYHELYAELSSFLAAYGKAPSVKTRINILHARRRTASEAHSSEEATEVVDLMIAVAKTLPAGQFQRLREQLEDLAA